MKLVSIVNYTIRSLASMFPQNNRFRLKCASMWELIINRQFYIDVIINGTRLKVDPKFRSYTRVYEPEVWAMFPEILKSRDVFLDVGANIGLYTMLSPRLMSSTGRVISFEPNPVSYKYLVKNAVLNSTDVVPEVFRAAVYDGSVSSIKISTNSDSDVSSECQVGFEGKQGKDSIPCIKLDDLFIEPDARIFLKIDVEGAEVGVLNGAKKLIGERKDLLILLAAHPPLLSDFGEDLESLNGCLVEMGLQIYSLKGVKIDKLTNDFDEYFCCAGDLKL